MLLRKNIVPFKGQHNSCSENRNGLVVDYKACDRVDSGSSLTGGTVTAVSLSKISKGAKINSQ